MECLKRNGNKREGNRRDNEGWQAAFAGRQCVDDTRNRTKFA
jgi:hypothetical protein